MTPSNGGNSGSNYTQGEAGGGREGGRRKEEECVTSLRRREGEGGGGGGARRPARRRVPAPVFFPRPSLKKMNKITQITYIIRYVSDIEDKCDFKLLV